jgi:hypothetical protein
LVSVKFLLKVLIDEVVFFFSKTQNFKKKNLMILHHQVWSLFFSVLKKNFNHLALKQP